MSGEQWFAAANPANGVSPVSKSSHVAAFIDAEEYFTTLRREVEATSAGGQVCWIGFEAHGDTPMPGAPATGTSSSPVVKSFPPRAANAGDATWFEVLEAAAGRGVAIRALLNLHPKPDLSPTAPKKWRTSNYDLVDKLNSLPGCLAINDFRYLQMNGTHHQKLVLVYNLNGLSAFGGTCDVEYARIVNRWCELHLKVTGESAGELYDVFARRWAEHTAVFQRAGSVRSFLKPRSSLRLTTPTSGNFLSQVTTTYGNPQRMNPFDTVVTLPPAPQQLVNRPHRLTIHSDSIAISTALLVAGAPVFVGNDFFTEAYAPAAGYLREAGQQNPTYAFAAAGHTGIYEAVKKAIAQTRETIYLEDQYLVADLTIGRLTSVLELLIAKVQEKQFKKLVILTTRIDDINEEFQFTGWAHRGNIIGSLAAAAPDKVVITQYKSRKDLGSSFGEPHQGAFYIHSKTWIFDDLYLLTGSANNNRRGYSHDSELDIGVYDQDKSFVRNLRIRLWRSRLNTQGSLRSPLQDGDVADFVSGAKYWEKPGDWGLALESNREKTLEPIKHPDLNLSTYRARITGATGIALTLKEGIDSLKMSGLWDFIVDPDGT
ncbi:MAG: hypothetical protein WCF36_17475 [Candidatus Nanopelagicales bacterium]